MKVDGGDCLMCKYLDTMDGRCTKHGYDATEMRDGVGDCDDYEMDEFFKVYEFERTDGTKT